MAYNAKELRKKQFDTRRSQQIEEEKAKTGAPTGPIYPKGTPTSSGKTASPSPQGSDKPQVIRDQDTGRVTFVETPEGKFFSGSEKNLKAIINKKNESQKTPEGAVEASQVARNAQLQELLAQQVPGQELPVGEGPSDLQRSAFAGVGSAATNAQLVGGGVGAAVGGALGSVVPGAGTLAGAGIGAAVGTAAGSFVQGFTRKLKEEQNNQIEAEYDSIGKSQESINKMVSYVRAGGDPVLAWNRIQQEFAAIDRKEAEIKLKSNEDLNLFLSVDGSKELANIRNWKTQIKPNIELFFLLRAQNPSGSTDPTELLDLSEFG